MSWPDPQSEIESLTPTLTEIRRDIHAHPELGFEEFRTQRLIKGWLTKLGYEPEACAGTGLVANLHAEGDRDGRTIALRADMDCLPMHEHTDLAWKSVNEGCAHKCGHDGHTAILLGVAAVLAHYRDSIQGNVRLIFQPAEEGVEGGGAKVMLVEGALEGVDEVYALHNWPGYPEGELRVVSGAIMAQVQGFEILVYGAGGHGAMPQSCRDPIVAAAALVGALQTIVSRDLGPSGGAVVSICSFEGGTTNNVIPEVVRLTGTIRTFSTEVTERVLSRVREISAGIGAGYGVEIELALETGYPVLDNDVECVEAVRRVGAELGGLSLSSAGLPMTGGEDFAYFAARVPAAYFFLGSGRDGEDTPGCHHPDFDFDDQLIPIGMGMMLGLVRDRLG